MKKMGLCGLSGLLAISLMACSSTKVSVASTCTMTDENNLSITIVVSAPDASDNIDSMVITYAGAYEDFGIDEEWIELYQSAFEALLEDEFLESMGLESEDATWESEWGDASFTMTFTLTSDALELSFEDEEATIELLEETLEAQGYTCE